MPVRVDVFADVACPFAHVSLRRIRAARSERGSDAQLVVRAWPLELVNGQPLDPHLVASEIADLRDQLVPELFTAFDERAFPGTSIPAFGLARAAYDHGVDVGEEVSVAIRDALFEAGRPIAELGVLEDIGARYGVDVPDAATAAAGAQADWEEGQRRGVQGSPHFFVDGVGEFCPALRIEPRAAGGLQIAPDHDRLRAFLDRALG
ncbi:MAG TPA: DsbA family protein [Acidimicrobiia bacterium]|nr:DsbA family protein [Acidimicrobiia bacterium]